MFSKKGALSFWIVWNTLKQMPLACLTNTNNENMIPEKITVEIWSDITCVHCFTAKRQFEIALSNFKHSDQVQIIWRSFELAPGLVVKPGQSMYEFLADYNGATMEQVKNICNQIAVEGRKVGAVFNFDVAIPANSFLAHQFSYLAKEYHLQNEAKEALYKAHFTDGLDIASIDVLKQLAKSIGMDPNVVSKLGGSSKYSEAVKRDAEEARKKNIKAVPFFLVNSTHSLQGAKESHVFLEVLDKALADLSRHGKKESNMNLAGDICEIGKAC